MRMLATRRRRCSQGRPQALLGLVALALSALPAVAQLQSPEQIQRQREEAERRRLDYLDQKRRVDHINERVARYKELMRTTPFELVPGTSNLVQVYVHRHRLQDVARDLYFITDGADEAGFSSYYWPLVLVLNRASDYDGGLPLYGPLDPEMPEANLAILPNIRKQGFVAIVATVTSEDSALAQQSTILAVQAYRQRLADEVARLSLLAGEVADPVGPTRASAEPRLALFRNLPQEPLAAFPPRRASEVGGVLLASTEPIPADRALPLEPSPPAWLLRQGVNMLGPQYEGYNLRYVPDKLDMQPEFGPIAFLGGRDPHGNPRTQPGMYFALNQRFFGFLLVNESAFVAFGVADAPPINGGNLSAGLDIDFGPLNLAGMAGLTALHVIGETEVGPSFAGKVRLPISRGLFLGGLYRWSNIERFLVEERDTVRTGVTRASYFGLGLTLR